MSCQSAPGRDPPSTQPAGPPTCRYTHIQVPGVMTSSRQPHHKQPIQIQVYVTGLAP
ncbi:unnamed protein product [Staurois parvus]|uniref:Uncharacterized protein n=1 Tax=Staurois parvus TaxID=386267 RepID=A0ABN9EZD9_9NEOB|nr:unnamed protein product [Staurois parvus]